MSAAGECDNPPEGEPGRKEGVGEEVTSLFHLVSPPPVRSHGSQQTEY